MGRIIKEDKCIVRRWINMTEEAKIIVKNSVTDEDFVKDAINEKQLLDIMGDDKNILTELSVMTKVYNEQIEELVRLRFDGEFFVWACIADPNDENISNKAKNEAMIKRKRKMIEVIRRQLKVMREIKDTPEKGGKKE